MSKVKIQKKNDKEQDWSISDRYTHAKKNIIKTAVFLECSSNLTATSNII